MNSNLEMSPNFGRDVSPSDTPPIFLFSYFLSFKKFVDKKLMFAWSLFLMKKVTTVEIQKFKDINDKNEG